MASETVTRVLPGEGLEECIGQFKSALSGSPFSTWLILPTERLVDEVRARMDREQIPYISSRICTLKSYCQNYFEENRTTTRYLSKAEAKLLLSKVLLDNKEDLPLFFSRGHPLPGTIDNLREFINVVVTRKIGFPGCLLELQSEKSNQINLIITEYRNSLGKLDLVDVDTLMEWTIDHLKVSESWSPVSLFIYGIHKPLPLEQDLLSVLRERSEFFRCFIPAGSDPNIFDDPLDWIGKTDERTLFSPSPSYRTEMTGIFSQLGPIDTAGSIRLDTFPSHYAEVQAIAGEICRLYDSGVPLTEIAVAFPEVRDELGIIKEVFSDFGVPWNAKISPRLSQSPVIRFLIGIIDVVANRYTREDVVRLISSPYFRAGTVAGGSHSLNPEEVDIVSRHAMVEKDRNAWLRDLDRLSASLSYEGRNKIRGISLQSVERVRNGIEDLFEHLRVLEGRKSVREFIQGYRELLETYDLTTLSLAPVEGTRTDEKDIVHMFLKHLDALSQTPWLPRERRISTDEFLRMMLTIADEADGSSRPDNGSVSVLGIRECAHLRVPYLFICGMTEGAVPRLTTRLPFTNSLENARMGTRSLAEILHEEEYFFLTALLSAEKVYLSAPLAEGDKPLLTSAFFERVTETCNPEGWRNSGGIAASCSWGSAAIMAGERIGAGTPCEAVEWMRSSQSIDDLVSRVNMEGYFRTGCSDSAYDGIVSGDEQISSALSERYGPEHVYSPTSLETYAQCPFRFFLKHVIHLEELPEVEPNLSAADRGTVIHDILTTFYRQWNACGRSKVSLPTMTEAVELMREIIDEELARYPFKSPLWEATCIRMKGCEHTGPGYFERFLDRESEEEESSLTPSFFEFSFGMERGKSDDPASVEEPVELMGPSGSEPLRIKGRIDRIDISPDGFFLIYDYKSGTHPKSKDIETGKSLQLPLYLLAFESISGKHGVAAGYYTIRKSVETQLVLCDEIGRNLISTRTRTSPDLAGTLDRSHGFALDIIGRIRKGEFPLPYEEKCPNVYCEFRRICRFNPYRVFAREEVS